MDKNNLIGFTLIGLVLIGTYWYGQPSAQEMQEMARQDSIARVEQKMMEKKNKDSAAKAEERHLAEIAADSTSIFHAHRHGQAQDVVLHNDSLQVTLSTLGGTVKRAELLGHHNNWQGGNVILFDGDDVSMNLSLSGKKDNIVSSELYFQSVEQTDSSVTMRLTAANGGTLDVSYLLHPHSYMMDMTVSTQGLSNYFEPNMKTLAIEWNEHARQQEKGFRFESTNTSLTYKEKDGGSDYLSETSDKTKTLEDALDWVAFKNQFFSCVLIGHQDFTNATLHSAPCEEGTGYLKEYSASMNTAFDPTGRQSTIMQMYLGPNDFHLLKETNHLGTQKTDLELEDLVYFGWPLFKWINRFFILYIFDWLRALGLPMGIVLLLLTIIVKALVYPATKKSFLSSARMKVLKPKVDALAAKYPNQEDAMKKQQETMQLYSQYGVSPMGGCLPMLIQMPIWIALFRFVPNAIQLRGESFLWAHDLSAYDELISWGTNIWGIGDHLSIFCLLFTLTNVGNTWISMRQQQNQMTGDQAAQMKMMQYMMYIMPFMFFFIFNDYSSGLCYYYFLSGITSILIMWFLRHTTDDQKLLYELEQFKAKHANDPKRQAGGFAARLAELQKQQEMMRQMQEMNKKK